LSEKKKNKIKRKVSLFFKLPHSFFKKEKVAALVAHTCNHSYSGSSNQEDHETPNTKNYWQSGSSSRVPAKQV
jgi:hypothetical protein